MKLFGALAHSTLCLFVSSVMAAQDFDPFSTVSLTVDFTLNGQGSNVDSIAFYEAPDPGNTLLFVTSKGPQLVEVWGAPFVGNGLTPLTHASFAQGSSQVNGIAIDQATDRLYVSADTVVYVRDASSGADLGSFVPEVGLETMASDAREQTLHIPDENGGSGIYTYDPDGVPAPAPGANVFGGCGIFQADAEGIVLYTCPAHALRDDGRGFFVVSDQRASQTDFGRLRVPRPCARG